MFGATHSLKDAKHRLTSTTPPAQNNKARRILRILGNIITFTIIAAWAVSRTHSLVPTLHQHHCVTTKTTNHDVAAKHPHTDEYIPNQVHFVKILQNPGSLDDFSFHFTAFLSVYAVWFYWRPSVIYLHTNAVDATINSARDGRSGEWAKRILQVPSVKVLRVTSNNRESVAATAVRDLGGVHLSFDMHALRDIRTYRDSGFQSVTGALINGSMSQEFFMSRKRAMLVKTWADRLDHLDTIRPGAAVSNEVLPKLVRSIMKKAPSEILMMDPAAFVSDKQNYTTSARLFQTQDGDTTTPRGRPSSYSGSRVLITDKREVVDWSSIYILQVTAPHEPKWMGKTFEHITPRHILEQRSTFARALYPVAKRLYDEGLINLDDQVVPGSK